MSRRGSGPRPTRALDTIEVTYSEAHWALLRSKREKAVQLLEALAPWKDAAVVHGSVARGDVDAKSDIDIMILENVPSQIVEARLEASGLQVSSREIAQATPMHSPKAHMFLDPEQRIAVTLPLASFRKLESEFYKFGGTASHQQIQNNIRRPGCTKKLTLIEPTATGHEESPVAGHEASVAEKLGISVDIVRERVRVLNRRDSVGRTGIFLKRTVPEGLSFEQVLEEETKRNPALRRTLRARKST